MILCWGLEKTYVSWWRIFAGDTSDIHLRSAQHQLGDRQCIFTLLFSSGVEDPFQSGAADLCPCNLRAELLWCCVPGASAGGTPEAAASGGIAPCDSQASHPSLPLACDVQKPEAPGSKQQKVSPTPVWCHARLGVSPVLSTLSRFWFESRWVFQSQFLISLL